MILTDGMHKSIESSPSSEEAELADKLAGSGTGGVAGTRTTGSRRLGLGSISSGARDECLEDVETGASLAPILNTSSSWRAFFRARCNGNGDGLPQMSFCFITGFRERGSALMSVLIKSSKSHVW